MEIVNTDMTIIVFVECPEYLAILISFLITEMPLSSVATMSSIEEPCSVLFCLKERSHTIINVCG